MGVQRSPSRHKTLVFWSVARSISPRRSVLAWIPTGLVFGSCINRLSFEWSLWNWPRWIGSGDNPLTARVMVNRIWQQMIGQGIVTSTENFGVTGQAPSHLELLDYLGGPLHGVRLVDQDVDPRDCDFARLSSQFNL